MTHKVHPHGLPHLKEAKREDGTVDNAAVVAGAQAWTQHIGTGPGQYQFAHVDEINVDDHNDILIVHRRKNK